MAEPSKQKQDDEMSIDDILSSIRKYVADEPKPGSDDFGKPGACECPAPGEIVELGVKHVVNESCDSRSSEPARSVRGDGATYEEVGDLGKETTDCSNSDDPFERLSEALGSYGSNACSEAATKAERSDMAAAYRILHSIAEKMIKEWLDGNLRLTVERLVVQEIERLKAH